MATASGVWYYTAMCSPSIHGYNFKVTRQIVWQWALLKLDRVFVLVGIMLNVKVEQRVIMKFCVKLGKYATETHDLLKKVYGDEFVSLTQVFEWFKRYKEGREEIGHDQLLGRPSTSQIDANIDKVGETFRQNRRLSIGTDAGLINVDKETSRQILHNIFNTKKVCSRMVARLLTHEQKEIRMNICVDILQNIENDPNFLENVITFEETWVFQYDPES